jgi:hypothetical protein
MKLAACPLCEKKFPDNLLAPIIFDDFSGEVEQSACPLCALNVLRETHGDETLLFNTDDNLEKYRKAMAWVARNDHKGRQSKASTGRRREPA